MRGLWERDDEESKLSGDPDFPVTHEEVAAIVASIAAIESEAKMDDAQAGMLAVTADPTVHKRRMYGPPRVSEDHKRERNRVTFKRFYHRRQEMLRSLREEEEALSEQSQRLLLSQVARSAQEQASDGRASFLHLVELKSHLQEENAALNQAAQNDLKTRRALGRIIESHLDVGMDGDEQHRATRTTPSIPRLSNYKEKLHHSMVELKSMRLDKQFTRRGDAFGWQFRCQLRDEQLCFDIRKIFTAQALSPLEMVDRTWQFCTRRKTSTTQSAMGAPLSLVRTRRRVLTSLDDAGDHSLVWRLMTPMRRKTPDRNPETQQPRRLVIVAKSIYIVSRLELPSALSLNSYAIVVHGIENPENFALPEPDVDELELLYAIVEDDNEEDLEMLLGAAPQELVEEWVGALHWWRVDELPGSHVEVAFRGFVPLCLGLPVNAWFMELLRQVVQWERAVLGRSPIDMP